MILNRFYPATIQDCIRRRNIHCRKNILLGTDSERLQRSKVAMQQVNFIAKSQAHTLTPPALTAQLEQQLLDAIENMDSAVVRALAKHSPQAVLEAVVQKNDLLIKTCTAKPICPTASRIKVLKALLEALSDQFIWDFGGQSLLRISQEKPLEQPFMWHSLNTPKYAAFPSNEAAVWHLVFEVINLSITDNKGRSPLINAVMNNNFQLVSALVHKGVDKAEKDLEGHDAAYYAEHHQWSTAFKGQTLPFHGHPRCLKNLETPYSGDPISPQRSAYAVRQRLKRAHMRNIALSPEVIAPPSGAK